MLPEEIDWPTAPDSLACSDDGLAANAPCLQMLHDVDNFAQPVGLVDDGCDQAASALAASHVRRWSRSLEASVTASSASRSET